MNEHTDTQGPAPAQSGATQGGSMQGGSMQGGVADAPPDNWVDRHAPPALRPYLRLSRADRPIGVWLLLLPCYASLALAAGSDRWTAGDLWLIAAFAVGAVLMRGAGCTWNDITDRDIDGAVARTARRPIPAGEVTAAQALAWCVAQALLAFGVLLTFNAFAIWVGVASLGFVAIYPFMKRFTWWPQVFLGLAFNWGALMGWAAHFGALDWPALLLYLSGVAWTLHYDTIYAHQDREDDALVGVKSTARLFGEETREWLKLFAASATVFAAMAVGKSLTGWALLAGLLVCLLFGMHLWWQLRKLEIDDGRVCLRLFRSNRDAGALLVVGFALASLL
jgi:4-hydroxybenzoate polyprenyltransferase